MKEEKEQADKKEKIIEQNKNSKTKEETIKKKVTSKKETNKKVEQRKEKIEEIQKDKQNNEKQTKNTNKLEQNNKETKTTKKSKKESKKDLIIKENPKELDELKLEKIEEEIKKQTTIPEEKKKKINKRIFKNIILAIVIVLYFIFINLGFYNLEPAKFLKDLHVFSIITIGITIIVFEMAYKKDNSELAIHGIEALAVSICTLITIYIREYYISKFSYIVNTIAILFAIYYVAKSIVIYIKLRKKALRRVSDIDKIRRVKG